MRQVGDKAGRVQVSYTLSGISVPYQAGEEKAISEAMRKMKRAGISPAPLHFRLYKKSVDARKRDDIRFVCTVLAQGHYENQAEKPTASQLAAAGATEVFPAQRITPVFGKEPLAAPPVVVGMGPCGLFAALLLAQNGYAPVIWERGDSVEDRVRAVENFYKNGVLDTRSNIQFGAGGAGTFSDGKLVTRINDPFCNEVLRTFVKFGAPEEILTQAKPHIGTDVLRGVVSSILQEIERLGGKLCYRTQLTDFSENPDGTLTLSADRGSSVAGALLLALGHSARDTYFMLMEKRMAMEPKPISVGVRIEHLQSDIDKALFGVHAGDPLLGKGEYMLSDTRGERGVYTFCMCPGGEVVAAASEEETVVVNGMSVHARDGVNANAAVAVSVGVQDIQPVDGSPLRGAIAFQRKIEQAAYVAGGRNYHVPVQTVGDFLAGTVVHEPGRVQPSYRGGQHFRVASMEEILPPFVIQNLKRGLRVFDARLRGFASPDALLSGAETRTSAPLRILRGENMQALGHPLVYPCGEGAGYAGGITSAAVDGIRTALSVMARFAPPHS